MNISKYFFKTAGVFGFIGFGIQALSAVFFLIISILAMFEDPMSVFGILISVFYGFLAYLFYNGAKRCFTLKKDMLNFLIAILFLIIPTLFLFGVMIGFIMAF